MIAIIKKNIVSLLLASLLLAYVLSISLSIALLPIWVTFILLSPLVIILLLLWPTSKFYSNNYLLSFLAAYIAIFCIWPQFSSYKIQGLPAIEPQRVIYGFLLALWVILIFTNDAARKLLATRISFARTPVICLLLIYIFQIAVALFNGEPILPLFFIGRELITIVVVFFITLTAVRNIENVNTVFAFITFGTGLIALLAVTESFLKQNLFASWMPLSSEYSEWATAERIRDGEYRVQAIFDNPLLLVDFLCLAWPITIYSAISCKNKLKILNIIVTLIVPIALLRTGSRAAILVMFIELGLFLLVWTFASIKAKKATSIQYITVCLIGLSLIFLPMIGSELANFSSGRNYEESMSSHARMTMILRAVDDISAGNYFGHGFGRAGSVIGIKTGPPGGWIYVLDNYFITLALDGGLLTLAMYLTFLGWILYKSFMTTIDAEGVISMLSFAIFLSIVGFITVKLISSQVQVFPILLIISACLIVVLHQKQER